MKIINCLNCKKEKNHYAKGMCKSCYVITHRRTNPAYKERQDQRNRAWANTNKAYFIDYYTKNKEIIKKRARQYWKDHKSEIQAKRKQL